MDEMGAQSGRMQNDEPYHNNCVSQYQRLTLFMLK